MSFSRLQATALALAVALAASSSWAQPTGPSAPRRDMAANSGAPEEVALAVGETRTVTARNVRNYSVGADGIVDVRLTPEGTKFVLVGKQAGTSTLLLLFQDGSQATVAVTVSAQSVSTIERHVQQLLAGVEGIEIQRLGARLVIDGRVPSPEQFRRVQKVAELYPEQVQVLATPGRPEVTIGKSGDTRYTIRVDLYFVQYDRNATGAFGVGWPGSIGESARVSGVVNLVGGNIQSATATLANQPLPKLDMAARHGWAKILKQATVLTNNGVEASFQNGGEQLFPVTQALAVGLQRVEYGARVNILPQYYSDVQQVDIKVDAEVSDLTSSAAGTPLPGRITSKLTTNVTLKLGQCLVLSGIRTKSRNVATSGLPLLSEIPILGVFFGSRSASTLETEGAILIVPSVVAPVSRSAQDIVSSALDTFEAYGGDLDDTQAYRSAPGAPPDVPKHED